MNASEKEVVKKNILILCFKTNLEFELKKRYSIPIGEELVKLLKHKGYMAKLAILNLKNAKKFPLIEQGDLEFLSKSIDTNKWDCIISVDEFLDSNIKCPENSCIIDRNSTATSRNMILENDALINQRNMDIENPSDQIRNLLTQKENGLKYVWEVIRVKKDLELKERAVMIPCSYIAKIVENTFQNS